MPARNNRGTPGVNIATQSKALTKEIATAKRKLDHYVTAIGEGRAPPSILTAIRGLEADIARLEAELAELQSSPPSIDLARAKLDLRKRLQEFDVALKADVPRARVALSKLIAGRIRFTPEASGYQLDFRVGLGPVIGECIPGAIPTGIRETALVATDS